MKKFRMAEGVITAMRWDGTDECLQKLRDFVTAPGSRYSQSPISLKVDVHGDLELMSFGDESGNYVVNNGDWVVKGPRWQFYPCCNDLLYFLAEPVIGERDRDMTDIPEWP